MGSLSALRRGSLATVAMVFGFLSLLLVLILFVIDVVLSTRAFPGALALVAMVAFLFILLQWALSPAIVRWALRRPTTVTQESNPWLHAAVETLAAQAGVPMPTLLQVDDPKPNAFVFGRTVGSSSLVVTRGLLERLNQDEIRAVLAHEIGHLRHRDVIIMTWVSAVPLLAYLVARVGFEFLRGSSQVRVRGKGKEGVAAAIVVTILVAVVSYLIYLVTQLLVRYLSRTREYYADAYGAAATRDPHHLASALTKIAYGLSLARKDGEPSGLRAFYIGDPVKAPQDSEALNEWRNRFDLDRDGQIDAYELQQALEEERRSPWRKANELFRTHPPTYKRILMLEQLEEEMKRGGLPANVYVFV